MAYDKEQTPSVEAALRGYFIMSITGKWYVLANKGEAGKYMEAAAGMMEEVRRRLYSRRKPRSPRKR